MADDTPRTRVRRHLEDAENAANGVAPRNPAPAASAPADTSGIKFFNGKVATPEQKAKAGKGLQDLLAKRAAEDAAAKGTDDTDQ